MRERTGPAPRIDLGLARAMLAEYLLEVPGIADVRVAGPLMRRRAGLRISVRVLPGADREGIRDRVTDAVALLGSALGLEIAARVRIAR